MVGNTTGSNNTAIGHVALGDNTTADNNTAVGYLALNANTTGDNNTAVGAYTGDAITTGYRNTLTGTSAGSAITTGAYNTIFGWQAGDAITTADDNVLVGPATGGAITTGHSNVAMGRNALLVSTTSSHNTGIGHYALAATTTGEQNTAVGDTCGDAISTANFFTGIGRGAGGAVTTGTSNTMLGYFAGNHVHGCTEGDENTVVGSLARTASATQSNAVVVGYNVEGTGGYTTVGNGTSEIRAQHGVATWATVSDERYKKDIVDSTAGLSFINALQPRTFKYKTLGELPETFNAYEAGSTEVFKNSTTNHGFIAQEIKAAIDADNNIKDGFKLWDDRDDGSQEVAEAALIPILVKALQEADNKIDALTTRVAALES